MGLDMYYYKASKSMNGLHYFELTNLHEQALQVNEFRSRSKEEMFKDIELQNQEVLQKALRYFDFVIDSEEKDSIKSNYQLRNIDNYKSFEEFRDEKISRTILELESIAKEVDERFDEHNLDFDMVEDYFNLSYYEDMGYQRKANAIHGWIVDNLQDGEDDQRATVIEPDTIRYFISLCDQVLENPEENAHLIPPQEGFFFGSTDIDEWYIADIKEAKKIFENALEEVDFETEEFLYSCWW